MIPDQDRKWPPKWTANDRYCRPQMIPRGKSEWLGQKLLYYSITVYYHNTKCTTNLQRLIGTTEKNHQTTETSSGHRILAKSVNKTLNCFKQHLTQVLPLGTDYYFVYSGSKFVEIACGLYRKEERFWKIVMLWTPRFLREGAAMHRLLNYQWHSLLYGTGQV